MGTVPNKTLKFPHVDIEREKILRRFGTITRPRVHGQLYLLIGNNINQTIRSPLSTTKMKDEIKDLFDQMRELMWNQCISIEEKEI